VSRSEEARLLYALLHAAEDEQRLQDVAVLQHWHALKRSFHQARAERMHRALVAFFEELERSDIFTGTWIEFRWQKAKSRRALEPTTKVPTSIVTGK
jgi:hypothetical protein